MKQNLMTRNETLPILIQGIHRETFLKLLIHITIKLRHVGIMCVFNRIFKWTPYS